MSAKSNCHTESTFSLSAPKLLLPLFIVDFHLEVFLLFLIASKITLK